MSRQLSKEQQENIKKFQIATQQLNTLQQTYLQMENSKKEMEGTLDALKGKEDEREIYRRDGLIMFKTNVKDTRDELSDKLESLTLRVSSIKKQIESMEKSLREQEAEIRASLNG